jgi:hypothetical protein
MTMSDHAQFNVQSPGVLCGLCPVEDTYAVDIDLANPKTRAPEICVPTPDAHARRLSLDPLVPDIARLVSPHLQDTIEVPQPISRMPMRDLGTLADFLSVSRVSPKLTPRGATPAMLPSI